MKGEHFVSCFVSGILLWLPGLTQEFILLPQGLVWVEFLSFWLRVHWAHNKPSLSQDLKLNPGACLPWAPLGPLSTSPADPVSFSVCLFVFLQFAVEKLTELERWKGELQDEAHTLIDFFCEDKETMKLDECLQIFRDFCIRFNKAVKVRLWPSLCFLSCLGFYFSSSEPSPLHTAERWFSIAAVPGKSGLGVLARLLVGVTGKRLCHPSPERFRIVRNLALGCFCYFAAHTNTCFNALKAFCW